MPKLKQLSCTIQWASTGAPFPEYATVYGDGLVESFIVVPNKPQPFTIHLKSLSFINEGLAMIVFVDGNYQSNRNRVNLKPAAKDIPLSRTQIDFLVRQREKPLGEGVYMGRQWRFDNHNIVDQLPEGVKESHFDLLGTIEVLVLRCRARVLEEVDESGSSSAADSDALCEKGKRFTIGEEERSTKPSDKDGPAEEEVSRIIGVGGDATNDYPTHPTAFNGPQGTMPYTTGWHPVHESRPLHGRSRSQHHPHAFPIEHAAFNNPSAQLRDKSVPPIPMAQKHVHFDLDPHTTPHRAHNTHRPRSHERRRPPTFVPSYPNHYSLNQTHYPYENVLAYGPPPGDPLRYRDNLVPTHYQQQPSSGLLPLAPSLYDMRQPAPKAPVYGVYHHYPPPWSLQPPFWSANLHPYHYAPRPYDQPPHMLFNPQHQGQRPWWPIQPHGTSGNPQNPSPVTLAGSSQGSRSGGSQQQNGTNNQGQGSNNNTNANWDQNGSQNNGNTNWEHTNQNNASGEDWSRNQNSGIGQDWINGGQQNEQSNTNANKDPWGDWDKNGNDDNGNSNVNDWANENNQDQQNNNFNGNSNEQDSAEDRALFGPHGQYYTYHPKGPNEPNADAEEEPRYDIPRKIASATGSTKQVLPGSGYMYWKKRRAPEYIDTMEDPYARFVFKYRTKDQLERETGIKVEVEPTGDEAVQELQGMDKQALIEMLIRAKGALGGKVPSPRAKPTTVLSDSGAPVAVEPPDHSFLRYDLPELRRPMADAANSNNGLNNGWNTSGTGGQGQSSWDTNNNDTTWANQGDSKKGGTTGGNNSNGSWDTSNQPNNGNVNWNRTGNWDGAGGDQTLANSNTQQAGNWNSGVNPGSASSSPSTLPPVQPFDPNQHQNPPVPPPTSVFAAQGGSGQAGPSVW